jgi:uncharacterized membrane protein
MRPLTIGLLIAAVTACFVASLAHDDHVAVAARLAYSVAFVASIIAFVRGLPRSPEQHGELASDRPGADGVVGQG